MSSLLTSADDVLRTRPWTAGARRPWRSLTRLALLVVVFGMLYGAVMGAFGGFTGDRLLQVVYSAVKAPLLLLATCLLALPSFFVLNTLFGLRDDFGEAVRAVLATQAGLTVVLASLAPLTALWYASSADYGAAVLFNGLMFGTATVSEQLLLRVYYRPLVARHRRHRMLLRVWVLLYAFVGIQMAWLLRPFVGHPDLPPQFLRPEVWGNAYVRVARIIAGTLGL